MSAVHVKTLSLGLLLAVGGLLSLGGPPLGWSQDKPCTLATLHGTYIFTLQGFLIQHGQQLPIVNAGQETFDGEGQVQGR